MGSVGFAHPNQNNIMDQSVKFDLDLINRYDKSGPRYTSYPTALELHDAVLASKTINSR